MSEELTVKSLRDRVSNAALSPDVKNELFTQLRYARTPEELAAIEARLTSAAPAPPTFKAPAETRTPLRTKFGKTPDVAYSARPSRQFGGDFYSPLAADPSTVITALLDERGAFADDKPSQRRPFTRAAFNEVVRALEAGPGPSTSRALVGRIEQLDDALVRYSADRYAVHQQVSDSNKAAFAAAVSELHDQVNNYLSAAQRYVAAPEGAPKVKTASSSRAVLSESDPRFVEAEKARKRQPTAPSPFAKQARPIARSRRADVVRTVAEKGRLIPLQKAKGQSANARFAAVLFVLRLTACTRRVRVAASAAARCPSGCGRTRRSSWLSGAVLRWRATRTLWTTTSTGGSQKRAARRAATSWRRASATR